MCLLAVSVLQRLHIGNRLKRQELFGFAKTKFALDCLDVPYYIHLNSGRPCGRPTRTKLFFKEE
jgi:hypothetical protein